MTSSITSCAPCGDLRPRPGRCQRVSAGQFLTESAIIGVLGGLGGATAAVLVVVIVALTQQWTPILQPWIMLSAPGIGALTGLLAGVYPAIRAARVEPVDAFRR